MQYSEQAISILDLPGSWGGCAKGIWAGVPPGGSTQNGLGGISTEDGGHAAETPGTRAQVTGGGQTTQGTHESLRRVMYTHQTNSYGFFFLFSVLFLFFVFFFLLVKCLFSLYGIVADASCIDHFPPYTLYTYAEQDNVEPTRKLLPRSHASFPSILDFSGRGACD